MISDYSGVAIAMQAVRMTLVCPGRTDETALAFAVANLTAALRDTLELYPNQLDTELLPAGSAWPGAGVAVEITAPVFEWRRGDKVCVRYVFAFNGEEALVSECGGGDNRVLFTGTPLEAVSEFVTLLDDVL